MELDHQTKHPFEVIVRANHQDCIAVVSSLTITKDIQIVTKISREFKCSLDLDLTNLVFNFQ
jgi:hypothetical protein